ncbi:MAG: metal ABC transporter substrate-binding protein [Proteobacteria bacterium]|nr:metal ABC transporter substrate-binding protein [Pseudomonadota bacterium]
MAGTRIGKVVVASLLLSLWVSLAHANHPNTHTHDKLKVAASFTIIADMAKHVAGDEAEVVSITKIGAEIHGYQPTPGDLVRASDADLILSNGLGLEAWFQQFLDNLGGIPNAVVSDGITPIAVAGGEYQGKANPHAWMGGKEAAHYIDNIARYMGEQDPAHASIYYANAEAYKAEVVTLMAGWRRQLATLPPSQKWLVTCEGAFSYLARDLGLQELYLWSINSDQIATPRQVQKVIDGVRQHNIPAVFCESTVSQAPAKQVARETGAVYGGVLYVDSLTDADGAAPSFLQLLDANLRTITDGLNNGGEVN